ncbi:centromere protein U isoform X2 [Engystomops pustulosus]|uniref:centromere protein U isoform X2 n=1 Tax=Engystomops pustulosus TaxID=76066 RepID=UPI003AFAC442
MSAKKKDSKTTTHWTKSPKRPNVGNQGNISKADAIRTKVNELMNKKVQSPLLKEIAAHADISVLFKEPGDALQDDIEEDSFNPPLHSTAVYTDDSELLQTKENPEQIRVKLMSPIPPVVEKSMTPMSKPGSNTEIHVAPRPDTARPKRKPQKKAPPDPEPGCSSKHGTLRNTASTSKQVPNTSPNKDEVSAKTKTRRKDQNTSVNKKSRKDRMETAPRDIGSPENVPKSGRSVNELDAVLSECGKLIELYRENVDTDVCKRAVDVFFQNFQEQLNAIISEVQKLKDLKRKNTKMQTEITRKRKRLIEVKEEIIANEPKLNQLQKECSELEKNQDSLKSSRTFLDNLVQLKEDYLKFKTQNPNIKETHGLSSLPALCLEAENVLKAEQHFYIVNRQLQSFVDKGKGDG